MTTLQVGDVFATRYRIDELIGEGGFAQVFRASSPHGPVALKLLRATSNDEAAAHEERFRREADILAKLRSPHTVRLLDAGIADGQPYLVSELLGGEDVADVIQRGPAPEPLVATMLVGALHALEEAHAHGLVHRDVTPTNIRIVPTPHGPIARLFDFGVARAADPGQTRLTQTGAMVGTPRYMAPEQLLGAAATPASDLYSLGVVAYEMLLGPDAPGLDDPTSRLAIGPEVAVSPDLRSMLNSMLEPSANDRPQRAAELRQLLLRPPVTEAGEAANSTTSNAVWVVLLVVIVAVCGIAVARIVGRTVAPPPAVPTTVAPPQAPEVIEEKVADAGPIEEPLMPKAPAPANPCDVSQPFVGWNKIEALAGLKMRSYLAYVPKLEPGARAPLIVLLTDYRETTSGLIDIGPKRAGIGMYTSRQFIEEIGLQQVADEHGVVLVGAQGPDHVKNVPLEFDVGAFDLAQKELCIDPQRMYVVGASLAGARAMALRCEDSVAGLATLRHRTFEPCDSPLKVPHIHFAYADDPLLPLEGGPTCNDEVVFPLKDHEQLWRQHLRCGEKMESVSGYGDADCRTSCKFAPFTSCVVPGHRTRLFPFVPSDCGKPPIDVDYQFGPAIWKFFGGLDLESDLGGDDTPVEADSD